MELYKISFYRAKKENWEINGNTYVKLLSKICVTMLKELKKDLKRNSRGDLNVKLDIVEKYINSSFNSELDIYSILEKIFFNLYFNKKTSSICVKEDKKMKGIQLSLLARIITFGTVKTPKISIIKEYLSYSLNALTKLKL